MKFSIYKLRLIVIAVLLTESLKIFSQNLPLEMKLSGNGTRLVTGGNPVIGFYDENVIQRIELTFSQPNYWEWMTANYSSSTDIPAMLTVNGNKLSKPVGVRFRGQTSYMRLPTGSKKVSFNITLDYQDETQNIDGIETLNLNNCFEDPSFMHEVLYLHQGRKHIPALKANYAHLQINGEDWGLYANVQGMNAEYLKEWFLSDSGTRWRALSPSFTFPSPGAPPPPGGGFGTGYSSMNYLGNDTSEYKKFYTLKRTEKANPWDDLVKTCSILNNTPSNILYDSLRRYLDIDRSLWTLATEIVFSDDDSYVNKGGMDYYLYWEPETRRMVNLEYDGNSAMSLNNVNWGPFFHAGDIRYALLYKLLSVPEIRQRFLAHMRTLIAESINQSEIDQLINNYFNLISSYVQQDTKKLYSFTQFQSAVQSLKNFASQRRSVLMSNAEVSAQGLEISSLSHTAGGTVLGKPSAGEQVPVTVKVKGSSGVGKILLYYGTGLLGLFERIPMYDDGKNNDGLAGDGVFGAKIPGFPAGSWVRYYVEAISNNTTQTATYYPAGAEHDVFAYQVNIGKLVESSVVINEFMASNSITVADQDGEFDDWIELYNNSTAVVDLSGWYLSDDSNKLTKWSFPAGTKIGPGEYLIVWADENGKQAGLHANFKLSASGESLYLLDTLLRIGQDIQFGPQQADMGYARMPNGTGNFVIQKPTFKGNNEKTVNDLEAANGTNKFIVYPNPTHGFVYLQQNGGTSHIIRVHNIFGQLLLEQQSSKEMKLDLSGFSPGVYIISAGKQAERLIVK